MHLFLLFVAGDVITQQFGDFLDVEARDEAFLAYEPKTRLDVFLQGVINRYPELWVFCRKLLLLSHGQATVEWGFSVNKEVETCNMQEDTVIAQRLICDYVTVCGGVLKVPLSKEMLASAASARSRYRMHLEQEKRKKMSDVQGQKRKAAEEEMEELKKSKATLIAVTNSLSQDADQPAEKAEGKAGTLSQAHSLLNVAARATAAGFASGLPQVH
ncbi:hypothetical protein AAFF_G00343780 [Aldrovandia affinis]|uniref:Uncharacterized protein n=1 Tax=Aldrovandia affinis TaxID=143900 RepID=A0AAD7SKK8_9TELE|nr:hypothetical protein AAFF_G00343780 [Aldrovandia affinis]